MLLSDILIGPGPTEISQETAFQIFPIAHKYGMGLIMMCCEKAFERGQLDLLPSQPIASVKVANHPGLVQCLALADARQCNTVVQTCLSKLIKQQGANDAIRDALSSSHLYKLMDGLRSETKTNIMCRMAGLTQNVSISIQWSRIKLSYLSCVCKQFIISLCSHVCAGIDPGHWLGSAFRLLGNISNCPWTRCSPIHCHVIRWPGAVPER